MEETLAIFLASPVASKNAINGWNPNPRLYVGAAPSFSECAVSNVASMFNVIDPGRAPASHARARALARAARIRLRSCSSIDLITRCVVVSDALAPNKRS